MRNLLTFVYTIRLLNEVKKNGKAKTMKGAKLKRKLKALAYG